MWGEGRRVHVCMWRVGGVVCEGIGCMGRARVRGACGG